MLSIRDAMRIYRPTDKSSLAWRPGSAVSQTCVFIAISFLVGRPTFVHEALLPRTDLSSLSAGVSDLGTLLAGCKSTPDRHCVDAPENQHRRFFRAVHPPLGLRVVVPDIDEIANRQSASRTPPIPSSPPTALDLGVAVADLDELQDRHHRRSRLRAPCTVDPPERRDISPRIATITTTICALLPPPALDLCVAVADVDEAEHQRHRPFDLRPPSAPSTRRDWGATDIFAFVPFAPRQTENGSHHCYFCRLPLLWTLATAASFRTLRVNPRRRRVSLKQRYHRRDLEFPDLRPGGSPSAPGQLSPVSRLWASERCSLTWSPAYHLFFSIRDTLPRPGVPSPIFIATSICREPRPLDLRVAVADIDEADTALDSHCPAQRRQPPDSAPPLLLPSPTALALRFSGASLRPRHVPGPPPPSRRTRQSALSTLPPSHPPPSTLAPPTRTRTSGAFFLAASTHPWAFASRSPSLSSPPPAANPKISPTAAASALSRCFWPVASASTCPRTATSISTDPTVSTIDSATFAPSPLHLRTVDAHNNQRCRRLLFRGVHPPGTFA
ncbi:hypothetical protein B0H16DRAFT_1744807 [Mycena metata]|uniref:Uncharacterized protein n=1 Tax=Mycena metata TaxID=1033252 RepID=A0AAD7MDV2_9AGAR|nr:hypothetical protein B0H16DRAFT_1744807 [Mycena metata]